MDPRKPEDYLREEYFALLPHIRRAAEELEAEIRHLLMPLTREWESHERIVVRARIKECESAIGSLRRRQDYAEMETADRVPLTLAALKDLAGVRILVFPRRRVLEIDDMLRSRFSDWVSDPVPPVPGTSHLLALKYHGYRSRDCRVRGEIQLMSMLIGMFWEIEHGVLYKPGDRLRDMEVALKMQEQNADVIRALYAFESHFDELVAGAPGSAARQASPQATADLSTLCG